MRAECQQISLKELKYVRIGKFPLEIIQYSCIKAEYQDWGYNSMAGPVLSTYQALSLIPSLVKIKTNKTEQTSPTRDYEWEGCHG